jgi:hypothetical protein
LWHEVAVTGDRRPPWTHGLLNTAYNVYVLFVSESVAPWFWRLGIPAALAVAGCLLLALFGLRGPARRFLIFASILVAAMALGGILYPRRLFMVAPWFLLAIAAGIGTIKHPLWRSGIALCLGITAATGWYGFQVRTLYAAPRFFEPWETVAQEAADTVRNGGLIVGNNPSFFLYLTHALQIPASTGRFHFSGIVTESIKHPQIWEAGDWEEAGRPLRQNVVWILGMPGAMPGSHMDAAGKWLDEHCGNRNVRHLDRDPSFQAKQRFAPEIGQLLWRVEIHEYACQSPPADAGAPAGP